MAARILLSIKRYFGLVWFGLVCVVLFCGAVGWVGLGWGRWLLCTHQAAMAAKAMAPRRMTGPLPMAPAKNEIGSADKEHTRLPAADTNPTCKNRSE